MNRMVRDIKAFVVEQGGRVLSEKHHAKNNYMKLEITNGRFTGVVKVPLGGHNNPRCEDIARGMVKRVFDGRAIDQHKARH